MNSEPEYLSTRKVAVIAPRDEPPTHEIRRYGNAVVPPDGCGQEAHHAGGTGWLAWEPTGVRQHKRFNHDMITPSKPLPALAAPVESKATQPGPPCALRVGNSPFGNTADSLPAFAVIECHSRQMGCERRLGGLRTHSQHCGEACHEKRSRCVVCSGFQDHCEGV